MNFFVNLLTPVVTLVVLNILIYRNMPRLGAPPKPATPLAAANNLRAAPPVSPSANGVATTSLITNNGEGGSGQMSSPNADAVVTVW